jgi:hypothetical protein
MKKLILISLLLVSCAGAERIVYQTEYRQAYIPVRCVAPKPERPTQTDTPAVMLADLIDYAKQLEAALDVCR